MYKYTKTEGTKGDRFHSALFDVRAFLIVPLVSRAVSPY